MDDIHRVELVCDSCRRLTVHELRYAGRILASTRCTACGYQMRHEEHDLRAAYMHDLEQRLLSKPGRMVRRAIRHPMRYAASLPAAVLSKPARMLAELRTILRR
jgi:tRNA(Ile2) C34 agmatinyltransferase TiaS